AAKTAVSDEEVIYTEENSKLYYVKYKVVGENDFVIVATTRPETILGDTAVCINPNDERYKHLKGKRVIVPIVNREVPIIFDEYVEMDFGTGCLKVTPAHDINDYELGVKHNLQSIDIFNDDGTLNEAAQFYVGIDRFEARKLSVEDLKATDLIFKIEDYKNKVGRSERTNSVIEPKLSMQWFLKMGNLAKPALETVENDTIKFYPAKFKNTYRHWMENIKDWCISRQLWWGHQIPAYYFTLPTGETKFVVAETREKAYEKAVSQFSILNSQFSIDDLRQDEDCLDTWFSSWLWPISVFDGINNPDNQEIKYYYPTQDLVTAPEIIFFWVARMVMAGYAFRNEKPFSNVYFTGIVRDKLGRKMSKSLGNSPDPIGLIEKYGADGVRVGILLSSPAGNDLIFDEDLLVQGRNFANKIWNAFRLIKSWETEHNKEIPVENQESIVWIKNKIAKTIEQINSDFKKYRISDVLMSVYKLVWDDYCSWFLETVKPPFGEKIDTETYNSTISILEDLLKIIHPFMPFLSEEIWQNIKERTPQESLIIASYPVLTAFDEKIISDFEMTKEIVTGVRKFRSEKEISPKETVTLIAKSNEKLPNTEIIKKLANVSEFIFNQEVAQSTHSFLIGKTEFAVPFTQSVDIEAEKIKIQEEIKYLQGFLKSVNAKLSNDKFVNSAPEKVVALEKKKQTDTLEKIAILEEKLKAFCENNT
ncbi:MAG: valine--tRNA ligase, partial [Flavobacteriaceae bacterium]|nr:valine--tRNA ligase [Flavobacteriaceae bacterium]